MQIYVNIKVGDVPDYNPLIFAHKVPGLWSFCFKLPNFEEISLI